MTQGVGLLSLRRQGDCLPNFMHIMIRVTWRYMSSYFLISVIRPQSSIERTSPVKPEGSFSATSVTEPSESLSEESKPDVINRQRELTDEGSDEDTDWDSALRYG